VHEKPIFGKKQCFCFKATDELFDNATKTVVVVKDEE
jgi:hypothetical protein